MPRKRKRRRSWGSVTTITKDKHVLRWVENTPEGRKRRSRTMRCTYREACFELSRLEVEHSDDRPVPTVGDAHRMWYEPWMARRVADGKTKPRTAEIYSRCWELHVKPRWGRTPLDSVHPADVQAWLLPLGKSNAKISIIVLRKIGDFAVQYEVTGSNRFRIPYEIPSCIEVGKRGDIYTLAEATRLFEGLKGSPIEAPYILAAFGSARTGESLGVRSSEVSLVESSSVRMAVVPIVRRMESTGDSPLPDGDLKTPSSVRTLIIPEPYGVRLYEIAQERIAAGVEWLADRGDGLPLSKGGMMHHWHKVDGEIPFANLRTSWRTFAQYDWGIDFDTLETLMGHRITGVTGEHYLKPTTGNLADAVARAMVQSHAV